MEKLPVRVILYCALLCFLLLTLDVVYTFGLRHNQNLKLANVISRSHDEPLLFHGACEPLWMISPRLIEVRTGIRSYNLALSHSDFADNYLHLYLYLKHNKAPRDLFLYVTPESFDRRHNTFNTYRFAPYLEDDTVSAVVKENDPDYYRWTVVPFMRYAYYNRKFNFEVIQGYKHYFTNRAESYYPDGFEPPAKRVWGNHAGDFAEPYKADDEFKVDSLRIKYLISAIRLAKYYRINVQLYESPVLEESITQQPNRGEVVEMIRRIASNEGVKYVQFENLDIARHKEYYISTLSFNMQGVEIFNDTLARYLKVSCGNRN